MKKVNMAFMTVLAVVASLMGFAPSALAAEQAVYEVASLSIEASDATAKAVNVKKVRSKIELKAVVKGGVPASGRCPMIKVNQSKKGLSCFKLRPGTVIDNSGRSASGGITYYRWTVKRGDNKFVKRAGRWVKASCGNPIHLRPVAPLDESMVVMVKQFTGVNMEVEVAATAKGTGSASVQCWTETAQASASTSVSLYATVSNKIVVKAKSVVKAKAKAVNRLRLSLTQAVTVKVKDEASVSVLAKGFASCSIQIGVTPPKPPPPNCPPGSIYNPETGTCAKDGSTTPPPPVDAPGPNPAPVPGPGGGGSYACYDEVTGLPVEPVNGLCPPGSYGSV